MKKGQGISINVIVITAIALIVLIVLVIILSGRIGVFGRGLSVCKGFCAASSNACDAEGAIGIPTKNCNADDDQAPDVKGDGYCCIRTS